MKDFISQDIILKELYFEEHESEKFMKVFKECLERLNLDFKDDQAVQGKIDNNEN